MVWKEEVWHCRAIVHRIKSSFTCIRFCLFNDAKIFDKVCLHSLGFICEFCLFMCKCSSFIANMLISLFFFFFQPWSISIHKGFCFRQGISSPISDLTERLLLEERDSPATPPETLFEAPPFDEVRFQAYGPTYIIIIRSGKMRLLVLKLTIVFTYLFMS